MVNYKVVAEWTNGNGPQSIQTTMTKLIQELNPLGGALDNNSIYTIQHINIIPMGHHFTEFFMITIVGVLKIT